MDATAAHPKGILTYCRDTDEAAGALQFSLQAEYVRGRVPETSPEELIAFAERIALKEPGAAILERSSGPCAIGTFGSVVATWPNDVRVQVWVLSNARDFVLARHTCTTAPDPAELREACAIVTGAQLGPAEIGGA
jgi:hypothetical protein